MTVQAWQINRAIVATAPAVLPINLDDLKAHLRITHASEDTYLTRCLSLGVNRSEAYLGIAMIDRTIDLWLDQAREVRTGLASLEVEALDHIDLPFAPLDSITNVYTYDTSNAESTVSTDDYFAAGECDAANRGAVQFVRGYVWPTDLRPAKAVRVRYIAGFGATAAAVPEDYRQAALVMAAAFYGHRGDCPATTQPAVESTLAAFDHLRAIWL